jgi:HSP20 family molecular chaperone IbpA
MTDEPQDQYRELTDLIKNLIEKSLRGEQPRGCGFAIVINNGEPIVPPGGGAPSGAPEFVEPRSEVMSAGDQVWVVVEMPGVEGGDIRLAYRDGRLLVAAPSGRQVFRTRIELPPVDPDTMEHCCKNGVLEVSFRAERDRSPHTIKIE